MCKFTYKNLIVGNFRVSFVIFFTEQYNFFIIKFKNYLENELSKVKWLKLKEIE